MNQDEDLGAFDPNIPEEGPSAPPAGWLDDVHGYHGNNGGEGDNPLCPPPPAYVPQPELNKNTLVPDVRVPTVSEDVARDALLRFVESKWRFSSKPARNLVFKELKPITVYRYRLETYTETRTSAWQFEPYNDLPALSCGPILCADPACLGLPRLAPARTAGGWSSVWGESSSVGRPGVPAAEVRRPGGEGPRAPLVFREAVSQVPRLWKDSLWTLPRERPEALHVLSWQRALQEQAMHFLSRPRAQEVHLLSRPRTQHLLRVPRQQEPAALHPAHRHLEERHQRLHPGPPARLPRQEV
uniref:uncharacterized protein ssuh2.1 isoform X4 n=1 Tax=Gasterosteus aculeatus aculeatus TaxID=481459 RepID=UPI001A99140E|nr:uncharacterized protein ssuh2.1 isoform X4 [Gasterosteus aculeatus aculeatus]